MNSKPQYPNLSGRNALVTGASGGLGKHFAELLARHGAAVTLAGRRRDSLDKACAAIRDFGGIARPLVLDVTDARAAAAVLGSETEAFDILVNNAGVASSVAALETTIEDFDGVIDTNLRGAFVVAKAVAGRMRGAGREGTIVNIASIAGIRVAGNIAAYAASKAALIQLTRALALEWARYGIRVNALCPGYIETDLNRAFFASDAGKKLIARIPQRRLGQPEDLDGALLLLCSDASAFMTGATIAVDGGHLVSSL